MQKLSTIPAHIVFKALDLGLNLIREEIIKCAQEGYGEDWKEQIATLTENPNFNLDSISEDLKYRIDFSFLYVILIV